MKGPLAVLAATLLVALAQGSAVAQPVGFDASAGYGYMPEGYNRLASAAAVAPPLGYQQPTPQYVMPEEDVEGFSLPGGGVSWQVIGEYLYMRASNAEVGYAQVVNGAAVGPAPPGSLPIGRTGTATPYYDTGFRVSAARALGDCAAIGVSYTYFDNVVDTTLLATANPQGLVPPAAQVRSLVFHPNSPRFALLGDSAQAHNDIRFHLADVDYKAALVSGPRYCANVLVGARFAVLDQGFNSAVIPAVGDQELMYSNVRFEGGGVRVGLEGERQSPSSGFLVYGKGAASFVAGTVRADYSEFNPTDVFLVDTQWRSNRVVTMLDIELGAGWANLDGTIRVTGGYMVSGWLNAVKVADYIRAVQETANFQVFNVSTSQPLAFDGLVFRVEWRF